MNKILTSLLIIAGCSLSTFAEKKPVRITYHPSTTSAGNKPLRSPLNLPIEVLYDTELGTLEISSNEIAGQASVYTLSETFTAPATL